MCPVARESSQRHSISSRTTADRRKPRPSGSASMAVRCQIRPATTADVARLAELERICFSDPWSPAGLREMISATLTIGLVALSGKTIIGYAIARYAADSGEILNLAVAP